MEAVTIQTSQDEAREALKLYRQHVHKQTPMDRRMVELYRQIARGRKIVRAFDSIRKAGIGPDGLPHLGLVRADATYCLCRSSGDQIQLLPSKGKDGWRDVTGTGFKLGELPWNSYKDGVAIVPIIPVHLRPKADLSNYHILWEADWKAVPRDPMLLRRLSGDNWAVLAAWDLTDVEMAVLDDFRRLV